MLTTKAGIYHSAQESPRTLRLSLTLLPPFLFSVIYFVETFLRASQKYFWYDELVTLYLCRLPFGSLWNALRHGVDFNPPLFFLVAGWSRAIFGETLIGMRAPEIIGFWILCLCLYRVVNVRAGWLAGSIAMVLPIVTGAFYYAYEARPHALVLAFCGLALVCWQISLQRPDSRRWLAAFSVCLLMAYLLHCYAVLLCIPFGVFELARSIWSRRVYWPMWIAMIVPLFMASLVYVPLLMAYQKHMKGTDYEVAFSPSIGALTTFYDYLLSPCLFIVIAACALFASECSRGVRSQPFPGDKDDRTMHSSMPEIIVGATFLLMPVLGIVLAVASGGPFFGRYFISTVIGLSLLIGLGAGARRSVNSVALVLIALIALPVFWNFAALLWHRSHGKAEDLHEPSTGFAMNSTLAGPLSRYELLTSGAKNSGPIAILDPIDFGYLLNYAPDLRPRLYYIQRMANDSAFNGFQNFQPWSPFKFNQGLTQEELLELSPRSFVYGRTVFLSELISLVKAGGTVTSLELSDDHFLAELKGNRSPR